MRVLAVRHGAHQTTLGACESHGRKTFVTVHDARSRAQDNVVQMPQFSGKEQQVVDVVARWILTGAAPDEIR